MDFSWQVHDDTCGSDPFPILLNNIKPTGEKIPHWKLDKANWAKFEEKCKEKLTHKEPNNDTIEYFTETLNSIAIDCIPKNATCPVGWGCRIHRLLLCNHPHECPGYDTKQSDSEVPAMLELWGMQSTPLLPLLPGPLWPGVVAPDKGPIYGLNRINSILMLK